jgi:hypothetical protein
MVFDTQQIELVGRAALETELIKRGFEVARPHRDKGIDLLVFLDEPVDPFAALPIQVKAFTGTSFSVMRKYERMTGLVLVYIWNVLASPRFFLMSYAEAAGLVPGPQKATASWNKPLLQAGWSWTKAPKRVVAGLVPFENRWEWLRAQLTRARG